MRPAVPARSEPLELREIGALREAGLAFQTRETWNDSLDQVMRLGVPHVSVYILEADEDSRLALEVLNNGPSPCSHALPACVDIARHLTISLRQ